MPITTQTRFPSPRRCPTPTAFDVDQRWQVVALTGEFLADEEVLVRNRPFEGSSGFEVITPFRLDDGTVFMVDRGWIAQNSQGRPSEATPPPDRSGRGRPRASRPAKSASPGAPRRASNSRPSTSTNSPSASTGPTYTGAYGVLVQSGADVDEPPLAAARRSATRVRTSRTRCSGSPSAPRLRRPCVGGQPGAQGARRASAARG